MISRASPFSKTGCRLPRPAGQLALTGSDVPPLSFAARSLAYVAHKSAPDQTTWYPEQCCSRSRSVVAAYPHNDNIEDKLVVSEALGAG